MTADALKKITTDALDKLAALPDEGHSDQLTALLTTMARFHKYSWHNVGLIASQCPTATRVAGFHTWRTMNASSARARRGSRSSRRSLADATPDLTTTRCRRWWGSVPRMSSISRKRMASRSRRRTKRPAIP